MGKVKKNVRECILNFCPKSGNSRHTVAIIETCYYFLPVVYQLPDQIFNIDRMKGRCLETNVDFHDMTEKTVRAREVETKSWVLAKGFRKVVIHFHQAIIRQAEESREE